MHPWYIRTCISIIGLFCVAANYTMHTSTINPKISDQLRDSVIDDCTPEKVRYLLDNNVISVNSKDDEGLTLLHFAVLRNQPDTVALLLERGAYVDSKDASAGDTPLHHAISYNKRDIVTLLLNAPMDLEVKNKYGETPLFYAIRYHHPEEIKLLLEKGADIDSKNKYGKSALDYIAEQLNNIDQIDQKEVAQKMMHPLDISKPYYINMNKKPATLQGTIVMYLLKHNSYNYVEVAKKIAQTIHNNIAHDFLKLLNTLSTPEEQRQAAQNYVKYYTSKPGTLVSRLVMYLFKRSTINKYDYIGTARQVATHLHDSTAHDLRSILNNTEITEQERTQKAKRYLKYYIERQPE